MFTKISVDNPRNFGRARHVGMHVLGAAFMFAVAGATLGTAAAQDKPKLVDHYFLGRSCP